MTGKSLPLLIVLVLGFFATSIVFISKYNEVSNRMAGLEKKLDQVERNAEKAQLKLAEAARNYTPDAVAMNLPPASSIPPAPAVVAPTAPGTTPEKGATAMTPEMREEIARQVKREVKEKVPVMEMQDPVEVMEGELGLSPHQKERIAAILKQRDEETSKLVMENGLGKLDELLPKITEIGKKYDAAINAELTADQQVKYAQLQKEGKLQGGAVMTFTTKAPVEKP